ncbi:MAG: DUF1854 domain-containing protein [Ruminococcaceae bacterium]|nr:DUF1854 domain-containing protein [Oscillospiraceae bacterium]
MNQNEYLSPEKVSFFSSAKGFLKMKNGDGEFFVTLTYAFPMEITDAYVGVYDLDGNELGMIGALSDFPKEQAELVKKDLERRYYCPRIQKILSVKTKMGMTFWECEDTKGARLSFSVKDTYKSILRINDKRFFIVDRDGARYEIEDTSALDKKSFSKLEIYL